MEKVDLPPNENQSNPDALNEISRIMEEIEQMQEQLKAIPVESLDAVEPVPALAASAIEKPMAVTAVEKEVDPKIPEATEPLVATMAAEVSKGEEPSVDVDSVSEIADLPSMAAVVEELEAKAAVEATTPVKPAAPVPVTRPVVGAASPETVPASEEKNEEMGDFRAAAGESMEETLGEFKQEDIVGTKTIFDETEDPAADPKEMEPDLEPAHIRDNVIPLREEVRPKGSSVPGAVETLSLKLSGSLALQLTLSASGQQVQIRIDGNSLFVEMEDGAEFRFPLKKGAADRKAS